MNETKTLVTSAQTLQAARNAGLTEEALRLPGVAILTFSQAVIDRLGELCGLKDLAWISPSHHPYAAAEVVKRGSFEDIEVIVVVPPMGASPMGCVIEDLAACGVQAVFLVCAAWSLGPPVEIGDLIVPSFSVGWDGTSFHYGNEQGEIRAAPAVVDVLRGACEAAGSRHHVGGNASCEAMYRITRNMVADFRERGCLCMENGEASTLLAVTRTLGIAGGVLFNPYIELERGWDPAVVRSERYRAACAVQAEVALQAEVEVLRRRGERRLGE